MQNTMQHVTLIPVLPRQVVKPEAILASNTSSISITKLTGQTRRPAQVVDPTPLQMHASET